MATYYIDYENGNDDNAGDSFAAGHPWKTITLGATAARIAPGDIIKIAKSPAPTPLAGTTATWTNLSKTVTLNAAETLEISDCDTDWSVTGHHGTSATASANDWKEGTKKVSVVIDASPAADEIQAFFATGTIAAATIDDYQGITFWIKNEVAILENQLEINLCSDVAGVTEVDTFPIPAIPSTGRWIPLTIFRNGGGNLGGGGDIKSINVSLGSNATTYPASKYIYIDNINACKTGGLNLQSLISKNSLEQGGTEGWYGIQSIVGTTVLLDNDTNTLANAGRGYYGTTGSANTYKRETIKTALSASATTAVQEVMDSGSFGNNIEFQAGYDTGTGKQTGETFFDGLNGNGYGIYLDYKSFITLNYFNFYRYNFGIQNNSNNITIDTISNLNNNITGLNSTSMANCIINKISNINNNTNGLIFIKNIKVGSINASNNISYGFQFYYNECSAETLYSNNNGTAGVRFLSNSGAAFNNYIKNIFTDSNGSSILNSEGKNYIYNATIAETTKVSGMNSFTNSNLYITKLNGDYSAIYTDGGNIISQASTLTAGSGTEWKFTTETNTNRRLNYPLKLTIAKIAVVANKEVTVTCYFKKGHATNIGARLVFPAQLGEVEHYATCPDDTNENNLSIAFTPTETGVIEIEAWAYYITGHSTVIVDAMTINQAA